MKHVQVDPRDLKSVKRLKEELLEELSLAEEEAQVVNEELGEDYYRGAVVIDNLTTGTVGILTRKVDKKDLS